MNLRYKPKSFGTGFVISDLGDPRPSQTWENLILLFCFPQHIVYQIDFPSESQLCSGNQGSGVICQGRNRESFKLEDTILTGQLQERELPNKRQGVLSKFHSFALGHL